MRQTHMRRTEKTQLLLLDANCWFATFIACQCVRKYPATRNLKQWKLNIFIISFQFHDTTIERKNSKLLKQAWQYITNPFELNPPDSRTKKKKKECKLACNTRLETYSLLLSIIIINSQCIIIMKKRKRTETLALFCLSYWRTRQLACVTSGQHDKTQHTAIYKTLPRFASLYLTIKANRY